MIHLIIIKSDVSTFPIVTLFRGCVPEVGVSSYVSFIYIYIYIWYALYVFPYS